MLISSKLIVLGVFAAFAATKDYENFDLPKTAGKAPIAESRLNYSSERVQMRGSNVRLKQSSVDAAEYLSARETFLTEKRDESIKLLRQQLDSGYQANRENMLLRLGQLYAEKYMELSYAENELFTKQLQEYEKKKAVDKTAAKPTMDKGRSDRYLKDALQLFYGLEKSYPKHPKIDEVLFFIGFVEMENGNTAKGSGYLERVVRQYPRSRKFDEAVVYLGDYYFEKVNFGAAMAKYNVLLVRKDSPLFHYAAYKIAWCELNTSQQTKGLRRMKNIVAELNGTNDKAKFNLREQALKDLVIFFAEVEAVDEAIDFFTDTQGRDKALENLKLIADMLRSKARDEAAIRAYAKLIKEFGDSPDAPKLQIGIYEARSRLGQTPQAVESLAVAIERYGESSEWAKSFPKEKGAQLKETLNELQSEALKVAFFHHQSAQKSAKSTSYDYALRLYSALMKGFPTHSDRKKIAFYRGEILYTRGKWLDAANSYMDAAKVPPKDKITDDSVYAALLALDRLTAKNDSIERYSKEEQQKVSVEPKDIPSEEQRFIEIAEYYMKEYPQGERIVDVEFRIAAIYYRYHHFDRALTLFKNIALKHPRHRSATTSAHIVLDILNINKNYDKLDEQAAQFAAVKELGDAKFKAEMATISGEIGFKRVESLERDNKWIEAGDSYMRFYKQNPGSPLAEKALYNAYISYEKGNDPAKSADTSRLFIAKYPKSEYAQKLTLGLAKTAERQYDFEQAQRLYQDFHKRFPKDKEARKALYNAAVFAELLERNRDALALYQEYLRGGVSPAEKKAITVSQAKLHRKLGEWDKVSIMYRRLARDAGSSEEKLSMLGELVRQYERGGKMKEREQLLNEIRYLYAAGGKKATGAGATYAAEAQFRSLSTQRERYEAIKFRFPPEDLVYLMKRKEKALAKLAGAYDGVVEVGVPEWGVAALLEKSEAYENYAKSFRAVQIPKGYTAEIRTETEKALKGLEEKLVKPIEVKAQEIAKACVARAAQFFVVSEYAARCRQKLKKEEGEAEPTGIQPQPSYASTRWPGSEVASRE